MDVLNDSSVFLMPDVVPNKLEVKTSSPKKGFPVTNLPIPVRRSRGSSSFPTKQTLRHEDVVRQAMDTIENLQLNLLKNKSGVKHKEFALDFTESSTPSPVSSVGTPTLSKKIQKNTQLLDKLQRQLERRARLQAQDRRERNGSLDSNFFLPPPIDFTLDRETTDRSYIEVHRGHSDTKMLNTGPSTSQLDYQHLIAPLDYDSREHNIFPSIPKTLTFANTDLDGSKRLNNFNKASHDRSAQVDIQRKGFRANTNQVEAHAKNRESVDRSVQVHRTPYDSKKNSTRLDKNYGSNSSQMDMQRKDSEANIIEVETNAKNRESVDRSVQVYQSSYDSKKSATNLDTNGSKSSQMTLNVETSNNKNNNNDRSLVLVNANSKLKKTIPSKRASSCPNVRTLPAALGLNKPRVQEQRVTLPLMDVDSIPKKKMDPISTKRTLGSSGLRVRPTPNTRQKTLNTATNNKDDVTSKEKASRRNVPFIATCLPNRQTSYSLTANRQQILALLKCYLPNSSSLRNMILNLEAGAKTNVIKRFITICEEEMAQLDTKYIKTLDEYEQITDMDKIQELDREMDKFQREYDVLKALVDKLKSDPVRPLSFHNDQGGVVHQMQKIQNAISLTFVL